MSFDPDLYLRALRFAARAHGDQRMPGNDHFPYVVHVTSVAAVAASALESRHDGDLVIACALLHDVVEDTAVKLSEIEAEFGERVAAGVNALTKSKVAVDPMGDSLRRIREQPHEVWMVKLADRIVNLTPPAPPRWTAEKRARYVDEGRTIHDALAEGHSGLASLLLARIDAYPI
ncbi:MAG: HD domain-containing protein [Polyangiales bacterium]